MLAALVATTAGSVGLATQLLPSQGRDPTVSLVGGAFAGALAVVALRSASGRATTRWMCVVAALLIIRFGAATVGSGSETGKLLGWLFVTVAALVLAARVERTRVPLAPIATATTGHDVRSGGASPPLGGVRRTAFGRTVVAVVCLSGAAAIGLGPTVAAGVFAGTSGGRDARVGPGTRGSALAASDRLDMASRPRLTDAVVMTVTTPEPGFWRSQVFDVWDGRAWTRSDEGVFRVPESGRVTAPPDDVAADDGDEVKERFRVVAPFALALPLSPTARVIDAPGPVQQWTDGSLIAARPLGEGASYSVTSRRRTGLTPELLRSAAPAPEDLLERYAEPPVATERVRALAAQITAGLTTDYDKVQAIEDWLDANTEYSLDAPLAPLNGDVVDDFVFESRIGWCEQIASSLTVLARLSGVQARLATGYVPADREAVPGRYTVRERDAHAWAEVWFDGVVWVPFDPTAGVPLSGPLPDTTASVVSAISWALLVVGAVAAFGGVVIESVRSLLARLRRRSRRSTATTGVGDSWPATTEVVLERVGERWGRPREPAETTSAYAADLAVRVGDDRLVTVGASVDRDRYSAVPVGPEERTFVEGVLGSITDPPPTT